jgi:protein TonB
MNRPPGDPVVQPPPESLPRKSASPLIWLLLLFALLALGWYLYSRRGVDVVVPDAVPPAVDSSAGSDPAGGIASDDDREGRRAKPEPAAKARIPKTRVAADREASPIARPQPDYPREAMRRGDEGTVVVLAEIDVNGVPTSVEVADRSGSRELDRSAVDAVRKWRFTPAMKDGRKVASTVRIPVEFKRERQ